MSIIKVEVEDKHVNELLDRTEGKVRVYFKGATPTRVEMRQKIGEALSVNPEFVVITHTLGEFGKHDVLCTTHVYKSMEKLKSMEPEYIQKRFGLIEEKKEEKKSE